MRKECDAEIRLFVFSVLLKTFMKKIYANEKKFTDNFGRERIFNGLNIVDKSVYEPGVQHFSEPVDDKFLDFIRDKGFNLIRLGFTWAKIEPQPGKYNDEYLDEIEKILDRCAERGIFAYLDMHQDLYSYYNNHVGDGAPEWAVMSDGYKSKPTRFVWAEGYFFRKCVHRSFDNFWLNKKYMGKGLQEYYCDMWKHVADRFKDKPALFGFDVMNEPFPGTDGGKVFRMLVAKLVRVTLTDRKISRCKMLSDVLRKERRGHILDQFDADLFRKITSVGDDLIQKFDTGRYMPFLNKTASAIREVTDNGIMISENCYYSNLGIPCSNTPIQINGKREPQQCFAPHGYDLMVDTPAYKYASNDRVGVIFGEHRRTQERLNVPVIIGEWGGMSEGTDWFPHIRFLLDFFDSNKWSNTYWAYFNGLFEQPIFGLLSRPYPAAVSGNIIEYKYDRTDDKFTLTYEQKRDCASDTVIFAHKKIESVNTDCAYSIETVSEEFDTSRVSINSSIGTHTIEIQF